MSAPLAGKFQDHYLLLGVDPKSPNDVIQKAYSQMAAKFARTGETPDPEKFEGLSLAYEVLMDPQARASFDSLRPGAAEDAPKFSGKSFFTAGSGETSRRRTLLCVMYDRARAKPIRPGLSMRHLEMMLNMSLEEMQFCIWYLKARGYAASDDKSNIQITVEGMDYIDANFPDPKEIAPYLREGSI